MNPRRRVYVQTVSLEEAQKVWASFIDKLTPAVETIPVKEATGRITAQAVFAQRSNPQQNVAAMDGYAVRFRDTIGASETSPRRLTLNTQAIEINTGEPLPVGFDAVVMVEAVTKENDSIVVYSALTPYENVRPAGEDIVKTELLVPENHILRPQDIGSLIAGGITKVKVRKIPLVGILPTGSEIVDPEQQPEPSQIVDFNSYMLGAMVNEWGGTYRRYPVVPDDINELRKAIERVLPETDVLLIIAGSSAGSKDFTHCVVSELGEVFVHGVNIKPGRPVLLGQIKGVPVIGIPGYPVSAWVAAEEFLRVLLYRLQGMLPPERPFKEVILSRPMNSTIGQREFVRVKIGLVRDRLVATPLSRGAGLISSLQRADGIIEIPESMEGLAQGTVVKARLLRSMSEIERTLVCIGSHDLCIDLLSDFLKKRTKLYGLSSAHVGSMGGILAIRAGQAHLAGTHLLDEPTGQYNVPFIKKYLRQSPLRLINLVYRLQGFIIQKGNPLGIKTIEDLTREDIIFVNRQKGSGTRLLLDKLLKEKRISPERIKGYATEEFTHMAVASRVASGAAHVGMGILAAAEALELDFIPVAEERYDLIVPEEFLGLPAMEALLEILSSDRQFRDSVEALGGYNTRDMGKVLYRQ